ncbi:MAG: hypothetical protein UU48_C0004G0060 [Candidatus Uhrbacteria bacterium GW2011_GWF2_41_16]|uniref:VWFA domain-containing protein n=1 Tax=Candidatus Uhrbacteria bacterium GW2011_GWF2_41_16 TaxID=1618997 RepID=A0A0G0YD56_9BACT|nr:MAG: hypothetical protein UT33_C0016G0027 [Candidatus Peregrinibacteria bacterium GW2011_GWC2_39_14]KKR98267.1 MAG: hypothetical protein UU48_C0004G0060 [Candidatus Uhrbacteria bacterium GW2011_GWF2_41_16]HBP00409.1 hypothetical protein [Candidatus Uhrbacteria bacterium]
MFDVQVFSKNSSHEQRRTISLLILDASTSMQRHGDVPEKEVNRYLDALREDSANHFASLVTFSDTYSLAIPLMPIGDIPRYKKYKADGNTLLWRTVKRALQGLDETWQQLSIWQKLRTHVVVCVMSDGEDNRSPRVNYPQAVQEYATRGRQNGWTLIPIGIGIDGRKLARDLGFNEDLAETVDASEAGIGKATTSFIDHTTQRIR